MHYNNIILKSWYVEMLTGADPSWTLNGVFEKSMPHFQLGMYHVIDKLYNVNYCYQL